MVMTYALKLLQKILPVSRATHMLLSIASVRVGVFVGLTKSQSAPSFVERRSPIGKPVSSLPKAGWNRMVPWLVMAMLISDVRRRVFVVHGTGAVSFFGGCAALPPA